MTPHHIAYSEDTDSYTITQQHDSTSYSKEELDALSQKDKDAMKRVFFGNKGNNPSKDGIFNLTKDCINNAAKDGIKFDPTTTLQFLTKQTLDTLRKKGQDIVPVVNYSPFKHALKIPVLFRDDQLSLYFPILRIAYINKEKELVLTPYFVISPEGVTADVHKEKVIDLDHPTALPNKALKSQPLTKFTGLVLHYEGMKELYSGIQGQFSINLDEPKDIITKKTKSSQIVSFHNMGESIIIAPALTEYCCNITQQADLPCSKLCINRRIPYQAPTDTSLISPLEQTPPQPEDNSPGYA